MEVKGGFEIEVKVQLQLLFRVVGWSDETKLMLNSTQVKVVVEVE